MMSWFAVYTNIRAESVVHDLLKTKGYRSLYLHYRSLVEHARKRRYVVKPYFPRYVFARVPGANFGDIAYSQGVSSIVGVGGVPFAIPEEVIEELSSRANEEGEIKLKEEAKNKRKLMKFNQLVKVNGGPFMGLMGMVSFDTGKEVGVLLDMFSGKVRVDFSPDQLSPAVAER